MKRIWLIALAASLPLAALPAQAEDARSLGMGGTYSAFGNTDINVPVGNPALLGEQRGWFFLGPNIGLSVGNNAVGFSAIQSLTNYGQYLQQYTATANGGTPPTPVASPNILRSDTVQRHGLRGFAGADTIGLLGLKLPAPQILPGGEGPSVMSVRVFGNGGVDLGFAAPEIFQVVEGFPDVDQKIADELKALNANIGSNSPNFGAAIASVGSIKKHINDGFAPLLNNPESKLTGTVNYRAYGTGAVTYAQPVGLPFEIPGFPDAKATLGTNVKLFAAPSSAVGNLIGPVLPFKDSNNQPLPVGLPGKMEIEVTTKVGGALGQVNSALDQFAQNPLQNAASMSSAVSSFQTSLQSPDVVSTRVTVLSGGNMGVGMDMGTFVQLDDALSFGAAVLNPLVFWPGQKTTYDGRLGSNGNFVLENPRTENYNFWDSEPVTLQAGIGYKTFFPGLTLAADVRQAFDGYGPSVSLGAEENIFNFLYIRAGGRFGGRQSVVGGGLGLNLFAARFDLSAGADPDLKAFNAAVGASLGF